MWVDRFLLNPVAGTQAWQHSWVVRHDGLIFGSGWYQNLPVWTQGEPGEYGLGSSTFRFNRLDRT
ncbi:MAG: hypothetical protein OXO50_01310 [Caldilineaceae bacterium]|nr:hypothetical protein [Caldilineaceae bacterium]